MKTSAALSTGHVLVVGGASCRREQQLPSEDRSFAGISLPQVKHMRIEDWGPSVLVGIRKDGAVSINASPIALDAFAAAIQKTASNYPSQFPVHIGADVATPFDKVWPVIQACRSNGIWKIHFAVTDTTGQGLNTIGAFLPRRQTDPAELSMLVLKDSTNTVTVGVHSDGFVVAERKFDEQVLRAVMQELLAAGDKSKTIIIIPSQGITHGQFMTVLGMCHDVGLYNICIMDEPKRKPAR